MFTVDLGNVNPMAAEVDGNAVTRFQVPDGTKRMEAFTSITRAYDEYHSTDPPEWVESTDARLAEDIAENYTWPAGYDDSAPSEADLEEQTVEDLKTQAEQRGIEGTSSMKKGDLVDAIRKTYLREAHECVIGRPDGWTGLDFESTDEES